MTQNYTPVQTQSAVVMFVTTRRELFDLMGLRRDPGVTLSSELNRNKTAMTAVRIVDAQIEVEKAEAAHFVSDDQTSTETLARLQTARAALDAARNWTTDNIAVDDIKAFTDREREIKAGRLPYIKTHLRLAPTFKLCDACYPRPAKGQTYIPARIPAVLVEMDDNVVNSWRHSRNEPPTQEELDALAAGFVYKTHQECTCDQSHLIATNDVYEMFCEKWYMSQARPDQLYQYCHVFLPRGLAHFVKHPSNNQHRICVLDHCLLYDSQVDRIKQSLLYDTKRISPEQILQKARQGDAQAAQQMADIYRRSAHNDLAAQYDSYAQGILQGVPTLPPYDEGDNFINDGVATNRRRAPLDNNLAKQLETLVSHLAIAAEIKAAAPPPAVNYLDALDLLQFSNAVWGLASTDMPPSGSQNQDDDNESVILNKVVPAGPLLKKERPPFHLESAFKPQDRVAVWVEQIAHTEYSPDKLKATPNTKQEYLPTHRLIIHIATEPALTATQNPPCTSLIIGSTVEAGSLENMTSRLTAVLVNQTIRPAADEQAAVRAVDFAESSDPAREHERFMIADEIVAADIVELHKHFNGSAWADVVNTPILEYGDSRRTYELSPHDIARQTLMHAALSKAPCVRHKLLASHELNVYARIPMLQDSFARAIVVDLPSFYASDLIERPDSERSGRKREDKKKVIARIRETMRDGDQENDVVLLSDDILKDNRLVIVKQTSDQNKSARKPSVAKEPEREEGGDASAAAAPGPDNTSKGRASKAYRDPYPERKPLVSNIASLRVIETVLNEDKTTTSNFMISLERFFRRTYGPVLHALNATTGVLVQLGFCFDADEIDELNANKRLGFNLWASMTGCRSIRSHMQIHIEPVRTTVRSGITAMLIHFTTLKVSNIKDLKFVRLPYSDRSYIPLNPPAGSRRSVQHTTRKTGLVLSDTWTQESEEILRRRDTWQQPAFETNYDPTALHHSTTSSAAHADQVGLESAASPLAAIELPSIPELSVFLPGPTATQTPRSSGGTIATDERRLRRRQWLKDLNSDDSDDDEFRRQRQSAASQHSPEPMSPADSIQTELASMSSTLFRGETHAKLLAALFSHTVA